MENIVKLVIICYCIIAYAYWLGKTNYNKEKFELLPFLVAPIILLYDIWLDFKSDFTQAHESLDGLFIDIINAYNEGRHGTMVELYEELDIDELQQFYQFCTEKQIVYKLKGINEIIERYRC